MSQSKVRYRVPVALTIEDKITAALDEIKFRAGTMGIFLGIILSGLNSFSGSQKPPSLGGHSGLWLMVIISVFAMGLCSLGMFFGAYSRARMSSGRVVSKFAPSTMLAVAALLILFGGTSVIAYFGYVAVSEQGSLGTLSRYLGFPLVLGGAMSAMSCSAAIVEIVNWIQELRASNGVNLPSGGNRLEAELVETPTSPGWSKSI